VHNSIQRDTLTLAAIVKHVWKTPEDVTTNPRLLDNTPSLRRSKHRRDAGLDLATNLSATSGDASRA
jgi:transaldolase